MKTLSDRFSPVVATPRYVSRRRYAWLVSRWPGLLAAATSCWLAGYCSAQSATQPAPASLAPKAAAPASQATTKSPDGWESLFDGKTLRNWIATDFGGKGPVKVAKGEISLGSGYMTGITLTNTNVLPRMNYEIQLDAKRVEGNDFFCGLTFPVGKDHCSLVVGGWGGSVVGLSSLDGEDASSNETSKVMTFENGKWYHVHVKVRPGKIEAWIDDEKMVDVKTEERRISTRLEMEQCHPLGVATWSTGAALRDIRIRKLD